VPSHTVANWGLYVVNSLDTTLVVRGRRKITHWGVRAAKRRRNPWPRVSAV